MVFVCRRHHSGLGRDLDPVEHIVVQNAGLRHRGKRQRNQNLLAAVSIGARESEQIVKVSSADVDVGKDRIDCVRIVVVSHGILPC